MSNTMWHVALKPGTTEIQDVILADVDANDFETIGTLLSTNVLISQIIESEQNGYLLIFDGEYERPYPSIMIWRFRRVGEEKFIEDHEDKCTGMADAGGNGCGVYTAKSVLSDEEILKNCLAFIKQKCECI